MTISSIRDLASAAPTAPAAPAAPAPAGMAAVQARIQALQQKLGYTTFAGALGQATAAANPAGSTLGALGTATAAGAGGASVADAVIADAKSYLGTPYVWGGAAPGGFDCSGLVQYVYGKQGVSLPRTSQEQQNAGTSVTAAQAQPGDLVFFGTPAYHEGIYLGNGQMLEAPHTGANVRISAVDLSTVSSIRRVIPQPATATAASVTGGSTTWARPGCRPRHRSTCRRSRRLPTGTASTPACWPAWSGRSPASTRPPDPRPGRRGSSS
jgi:cell wall-associated NlpC family hydrolase